MKDNEVHEDIVDELLESINSALAVQVNDNIKEETIYEDIEEESEEEKNSRKKMAAWLKVSTIVFSIILFLGIGLIASVKIYLGRLDRSFDTEVKKEIDEVDDLNEFEEMNPDNVKWSQYYENAKQVSGVVNILLVGEEAINDGGSRGRTDSIMIATINTRIKALKLTSIMRDTYVQIPGGYKDNKVNAAYHIGGIPLLKDTIEANFDVKIDGSVLVNFDGFEQIIDKLGGVEITLTESEAKYLRTTNYISKKENRNVVEGKQTLNGNQALGYARIRYRATADGTRDDFGRTSRHRILLTAIFDKYKTKNFAQLATIAYDILPLVTTDISDADIINYLSTVVTMGTTELETFRIPTDDGYYGAKIRGMSVLVPDLNANRSSLHNFIFAEAEELE